MAGAKRTVEYTSWDGSPVWYKVKSDKIEIPDFGSMSRFEALQWLSRHTYPRGYSKPNPLAGMGGAINCTTR